MSDNIVNWDAIVHKNARTSDRGDAGNIIEIEDATITLERGPTTEFVVPKEKVEGSMAQKLLYPSSSANWNNTRESNSTPFHPFAGFRPASAIGFRKMLGLKEVVWEEKKQSELPF